jgi:hypothetical protein
MSGGRMGTEVGPGATAHPWLGCEPALIGLGTLLIHYDGRGTHVLLRHPAAEPLDRQRAS